MRPGRAASVGWCGGGWGLSGVWDRAEGQVRLRARARRSNGGRGAARLREQGALRGEKEQGGREGGVGCFGLAREAGQLGQRPRRSAGRGCRRAAVVTRRARRSRAQRRCKRGGSRRGHSDGAGRGQEARQQRAA